MNDLKLSDKFDLWLDEHWPNSTPESVGQMFKAFCAGAALSSPAGVPAERPHVYDGSQCWCGEYTSPPSGAPATASTQAAASSGSSTPGRYEGLS